MTEAKTIQIIVDDIQIVINTETEITQTLLSRMEKQIHAIVNENFYHDIYGRITSINMTLYMIERMTPPDGRKHLNLLKSQITDLSQMIENLAE